MIRDLEVRRSVERPAYAARKKRGLGVDQPTVIRPDPSYTISTIKESLPEATGVHASFSSIKNARLSLAFTPDNDCLEEPIASEVLAR